jgi:acetyl esterase/lipase
MFVANSTDELIPLDQATTMAARLRAAGVPVRLDVIPGNGHAVAYAASAVGPSLAFLTKYLGPSSNQSSSAFRFEV